MLKESPPEEAESPVVEPALESPSLLPPPVASVFPELKLLDVSPEVPGVPDDPLV